MFPFFRDRSKTRKTQKLRGLRSYSIERLEDRQLLTTFTVTTLDNDGAGSFRQAIVDANTAEGADVIAFGVVGTITLNSSLPAVTDEVNIDGRTAPGFENVPLVEVDYNNKVGLQFNTGSAQSAVHSLALVHGSGNGITINGANAITVTGSYIGLDLDGVTVEPNKGSGISITNSNLNVIGGQAEGDGNVISANLQDGITLNTSNHNTIAGNYIGTDSTGAFNRGNGGDGISLNKSNDNLIGHDNPIESISYFDSDGVSLPVSGWQGLRGGSTADEYILVGTSNANGLLYIGSIDGTNGTSYAVNYPDAFNTSVYGPNLISEGPDTGELQLVGDYKNEDFQTSDVVTHGFLFQGTVNDLNDASHYTEISYPGAKFNYVHSTMGGLAVGNYDSPDEVGTVDLPLGPGHGYIYDIATETFLTDVVYPGSESNSVYGIWWNGGTKYTLVGGYSFDPVNNLEDQNHPIGSAFIVDYDSHTGLFTNWASYNLPSPNTNLVTHFEAISSVEKGVYTLCADSLTVGSDDPAQGTFVTIRRNNDQSFGDAEWVPLTVPGSDPDEISSSNSVYGNQVVGIVIGPDTLNPFQATINEEFQLSNVISGNGGDGISFTASNNNTVAMNFIGTDVTGLIDMGNEGNGILITSKSAGNLIGGEAMGGNDPTNAIFHRPPQGNLISGNSENGVLINGKATGNQLSGNYIGTNETGSAPLGNDLDGVLIDGADGNALIGCSLVQDPFVYYNVIGGNGGNGLQVHNSDNTTIQANFFGMGADNNTSVGNTLNGVLINGNSAHTTMGGPIPLGNVVNSNELNGILLADKASDFISFNSFVGVAAFTPNAALGNGQDGIKITTSGGGIEIRTNVISSNHDDGVDISGKAKNVRVYENMIGVNTNGSSAIGNHDNGVEVSGKAKDILIGGPADTFSIIPHNVIGGNMGHGIAILGKANNITVNASYIGTNVMGEYAIPNVHDGILLAAGTKDNQIGSADPELLTVVSGNTGNGIHLEGTTGNTIIGTLIGTDAEGLLPIGNGGHGIHLVNSSKNSVGSSAVGVPANVIANNDLDGVFVQSGNQNGIHRNSIYANDMPGIAVDENANDNPVAPVLTSAVLQIGNIVIAGTLTSKPKTTFNVEFFASAAGNPSGKQYLGSVTVKTDNNGVAALNLTTLHPTIGLDFITATATDAKDNTSEFSDDVQSTGGIV